MKKILVVLIVLLIGISSLQAEKKLLITNVFYGADMDKVSYSGAKIALKLWLKKTTRNLKGTTSQMLFYTDFNHLEKDIKDKGKIDTLIITSYSYLMHLDFCKKYFKGGWIKSEIDGKPLMSYVILKRKGVKIQKNATVRYYKYSKILKLILQKYAIKHNLNLNYETTKKESKPVLDLFFKKCDLAITNQFSWKLMQELNPQLSKSLVVVHKTERIFTSLISLFSKNMSNFKKKLYLKSIKDIRTTQSGKQLMQLFKFNKLLKLENNSFRGLEKFYKNYLILKKEHE